MRALKPLLIAALAFSALAGGTASWENVDSVANIVSKRSHALITKTSFEKPWGGVEHIRKRLLESENLELALNNFIDNIRRFIYDSVFDALGFEQQAESLENELATITAAAEKLAHQKSRQAVQLSFAHSLFRSMADSLEFLRLYKILGPPEHRFLHFVIDLNLRLLALRDPLDLSDANFDEFSLKITGFSRSISYWEYKFNDLIVPFGTRWLFRQQLEKAKKGIGSVQEQMSEKQEGRSDKSFCGFLFFKSRPSLN